ncbi:uracil-DNA glycosylase [Paenibacillus glycanilyticus]|uniref:Uracil-DNA glycosylase n=1 Tax=Paenibacillus glycanilyticus TaxID=126569 RepID=A0ABQ6NDE8_9BACL|nr:uracil-DNA glycosylase [Paenibacillus glycanilyticus]GMK43025.1 uracil-DNA glycosylase [Paenibacillus glycanilyticus]
MDFQLDNDWAELLQGEMDEPYFKQMEAKLGELYETKTVYPKAEHIFNALSLTPYEQTRVVIIGQDPYHGQGQAHGLSFSVQEGVAIPPSLRNIYKELQQDIGCPIPQHGSLASWAKQGVLLLNTVLTVEEGQPNSHQKLGWERFTDRIIRKLNEREEPVVFILWGKHAQDKAAFIDTSKHRVIASAHPSPLAARKGFFGSRPFSRVNEHLRSFGYTEIDWSLPEHPEQD